MVEKDVNQLLADGKTALSIINEWMIPALNVVGEQFEKKKLFLPQLLVSADAAKAGFEILKQSLKTGNASEDGEPIVVCTVKGDIHDIGKNIVKVLLENYGYRVIDLGKDVPPERWWRLPWKMAPNWWGLAPNDYNCQLHGRNHPPAAESPAWLQGDGGRRRHDGRVCQEHRGRLLWGQCGGQRPLCQCPVWQK